MDYTNYLTELCEDLNLNPQLEQSQKGNPLLRLTDSLQIEVTKLDPGFFFHSPLCPCPKVKQEDLFIHLMKANLFGQGTLGATIGMDIDENLLTLSLALPYDMKYQAFKETLEDFTNIIEYWREEIERHVKMAESGIL